MYEGAADPYCYAGTTVSKSIPGFAGRPRLDHFETIVTP